MPGLARADLLNRLGAAVHDDRVDGGEELARVLAPVEQADSADVALLSNILHNWPPVVRRRGGVEVGRYALYATKENAGSEGPEPASSTTGRPR